MNYVKIIQKMKPGMTFHAKGEAYDDIEDFDGKPTEAECNAAYADWIKEELDTEEKEAASLADMPTDRERIDALEDYVYRNDDTKQKEVDKKISDAKKKHGL